MLDVGSPSLQYLSTTSSSHVYSHSLTNVYSARVGNPTFRINRHTARKYEDVTLAIILLPNDVSNIYFCPPHLYHSLSFPLFYPSIQLVKFSLEIFCWNVSVHCAHFITVLNAFHNPFGVQRWFNCDINYNSSEITIQSFFFVPKINHVLRWGNSPKLQLIYVSFPIVNVSSMLCGKFAQDEIAAIHSFEWWHEIRLKKNCHNYGGNITLNYFGRSVCNWLMENIWRVQAKCLKAPKLIFMGCVGSCYL